MWRRGRGAQGQWAPLGASESESGGRHPQAAASRPCTRERGDGVVAGTGIEFAREMMSDKIDG